jgi:hypothetical protein
MRSPHQGQTTGSAAWRAFSRGYLPASTLMLDMWVIFMDIPAGQGGLSSVEMEAPSWVLSIRA